MALHLRIKICGITNPADACRAAGLGADAVGLNFYPQSPRCVTLPIAVAVLRELPPFVEPVGLFVNQPLPQVLDTLQFLDRIRTVQGYGTSREVHGPLPFQLIPAFSVRDHDSLLEITRYLDHCRELGQLPAAVLVDAHVPGLHGGTGQTAPWQLLADFRPGFPLLLAGGLTPENVAEAVRIVRPYAVDVASGVESSPGQKDEEKMRRFIGNAREAAARL
jgi:phosphoribosylanthranilate isomerase